MEKNIKSAIKVKNMNKDEDLSNNLMIADILIRLKAFEDILIDKNVFTKEEFSNKVKEITQVLTMDILQKANVSGDLNTIIEDLKK